MEESYTDFRDDFRDNESPTLDGPLWFLRDSNCLREPAGTLRIEYF